jgi:hypothetical protein
VNCSQCNDLSRMFALRRAGYVTARAAPFYRISTELAARMQVDMERARTSIQEHRSTCHFAQQNHLPRLLDATA